MKTKLKIKNNVLELFNMLNLGEKEKNEILNRLKIKVPTFYKNLQKLKIAGFEIKKKNNYYYLEKYRNIIIIDDKEKSAIAYMLYLAFSFLPKSKYDKFLFFIKKYILLAKKEDFDEIIKRFNLIKKYFFTEEYKEKIQAIEILIAENKKANITLRSGKIITIQPLKFSWKKERVILEYVNIKKNSDEKINLEQIVKIENYNGKNYFVDEEELIFELYGNLSKRYLLKQEERVVKNTKDSIVIASKIINKDALFKRLLRYDNSCKILFPKKEVEAFNKLIDEAIINLDLKE